MKATDRRYEIPGLGLETWLSILTHLSRVEQTVLPIFWRTLRRHQPKEVLVRTVSQATRIDWNDDLTQASISSTVQQLLSHQLSA
jgi:hypothetical protein